MKPTDPLFAHLQRRRETNGGSPTPQRMTESPDVEPSPASLYRDTDAPGYYDASDHEHAYGFALRNALESRDVGCN